MAVQNLEVGMEIDDQTHEENLEIAAELAENERLAQTRELRKYAAIWIFVLVSINLSLKVKQMTLYGTKRIENIVAIAQQLLYQVPGIFYVYFYPLWNYCKKRRPNRTTLASYALRVQTCCLCVPFIVYEVAHIIPCTMHSNFWISSFFSEENQVCSKWVVVEHFCDLGRLLGWAVFVFFNKHYPRETKFDLILLTIVVSGAIYCYAITMIQEQLHIFHEVVHQRVFSTVFFISSPHFNKTECDKGFWECLLERYLAIFYVLITEFLVVVISIIIGIIYQVGQRRERRPRQNHGHGRIGKKMTIWAAFVFFTFAIQALLLIIHVETSGSLLRQELFMCIVFIILSLGIYSCWIFNKTNDPTLLQNEPRSPSENLDRYLLYFGTLGVVLFLCASIIDGIYLIEVDWFNGLTCLLMNSISMSQVIFQTVTILHCDMARSRHAYAAGIVLWLVNFGMFCLDLFDAATLFNYFMHSSDIPWLLFLRGLGPFNVFYRFHSLAVIAEKIEHHLHEERREGERAPLANGDHNQVVVAN